QRPRFEPRASSPGSSRDIAVTRNSTPIRYAGSRTVPRALDASQTREGGRAAALDRQTSTATPRYINRGDEIIRSQTERPAAAAAPLRVNRPGPETYAIPRSSTAAEAGPERAGARTVPATPARAGRPAGSPVYQPHYEPRTAAPPRE